MKRVECIGIVGQLPTPKGLLMFWDTGRNVSPVDLAQVISLQHFAFRAEGTVAKQAISEIFKLAGEIARKVNVYPIGYAALADDGRILVTEPWFESEE